MFMAEIQIPTIGSVSKKCETIDEGIVFLNQNVAKHDNYKKAEIFDLAGNKIVLSLRVVR